MIRTTAFLAIVLSITACSNKPPAPTFVEVKVPVTVPCQAKPVERPVFAVDLLKSDAGIAAMMKALRAERHQRIGYEKQLVAAIEACR